MKSATAKITYIPKNPKYFYTVGNNFGQNGNCNSSPLNLKITCPDNSGEMAMPQNKAQLLGGKFHVAFHVTSCFDVKNFFSEQFRSADVPSQPDARVPSVAHDEQLVWAACPFNAPLKSININFLLVCHLDHPKLVRPIPPIADSTSALKKAAQQLVICTSIINNKDHGFSLKPQTDFNSRRYSNSCGAPTMAKT